MVHPVGSRAGMPERLVTLVLCTAEDGVLGCLPSFEVVTPWWQQVREVVDATRARFGLDVTILRLLWAEAETPPQGGPVTYLAQLDTPPRQLRTRPAPASLASEHPGRTLLTPWPGDPLAPHPLRAPYAQPGGPQTDLAWAQVALTAAGLTPSGPARQIRTWNLSSIWTIPTTAGPAWLKAVPPFLAHEPALLAWLQRVGPGPGRAHPGVPAVIAAGPGRVLLADVAGEDQYGAHGVVTADLLHLLIDLQVACLPLLADLAAVGVPDARAEHLPARAEHLLSRVGAELDAADRDRAARLVAGLSTRLAAIAACGVPDTLVHGDFHPGNLRGEPAEPGRPGRYAVLDWADTTIGQPVRDIAHYCGHLRPDDRPRAYQRAEQIWQAAAPGCEPLRAAHLAEPVAALQAALAWQSFLDSIEPDERAYHDGDPAAGLTRASRLADARPSQ
jgi:hypothetical protein